MLRVVAGIDPGANMGLCVLALPAGLSDVEAIVGRAEWRGSCRLATFARKSWTSEQNAYETYLRLCHMLTEMRVTEVAVEEPSDALRTWRRAQQTGTAFALGRSYERAMLAACASACAVQSFRVTEWMPKARAGRLVHTQKRELTLDALDSLSRQLRRLPARASVVQQQQFPTDWSKTRDTNDPHRLSADECMALGVLLYYLSRQPPEATSAEETKGSTQKSTPRSTGRRSRAE